MIHSGNTPALEELAPSSPYSSIAELKDSEEKHHKESGTLNRQIFQVDETSYLAANRLSSVFQLGS